MSQEIELTEIVARLQSIGDDEFEDFIGDFFNRVGWEVQVTQTNKDGGIDCVAEKGGVVRQKANIQAKRYSEGNKVGEPEIKQYSALKTDPREVDVDHAVVVTTSSFTEGAFSTGKAMNIKLLDGKGLAVCIQKFGLMDILDEYAPSVPSKTLSKPEEYERDVRSEYYENWSPEEMSTIFDDYELMRALEIIEDRRVGTVRVKAMDKLRGLIDNDDPSLPEDLLLADPWLMDLNWYGIDHRGDETSKLNNMDPDPSDSVNCSIRALCIEDGDRIFVVCLLPTDQTVQRSHLIAMEDYVDRFALSIDDDKEIYGRIIGKEVGTDGTTVQKLNRLGRSNFRCDTYKRLLEAALRANVELMQAVRPFALRRGDEATIQRLRKLSTVHRTSLQAAD